MFPVILWGFSSQAAPKIFAYAPVLDAVLRLTRPFWKVSRKGGVAKRNRKMLYDFGAKY